MVLTAETVKSLLTWTSTSLPSDLRICASYGALESTLVSTRSTVPETFFSAAACTLAAVSPVRSFSVLPLTVCPPCDGSCRGAPAGAPDADGVGDGLDDEPAAFAMVAPPSAAA